MNTRRIQLAAGFSIVELVIVLLVMTSMAAIAIPRISNSINRYRADLLARRITDDLSHAQSNARRIGAWCEIAFEPDRNRYKCENLPSLRNPAGYLIVEIEEGPFYGRLLTADFSGGQTLKINGHGLPAQTGVIAIMVGDERRLITVDSEGMVTTSRVVNSSSSAEGHSVKVTN